MELRRRNLLLYWLLAAAWVLVVGWQVREHIRIRDSAETNLRNQSQEIANTLSAVIRAMQFRGGIIQDRLEPVLNELVRTNDFVKSSKLISIALLNTANEPLVSAGAPLDFSKGFLEEGEHWGRNTVTFVNPVEGVTREGSSNATVVLPPPPRDFTNTMRDVRGFSRREGRPPPAPANDVASTNGDRPPPPPDGPDSRPSGGRSRSRRPPWLRGMDEKEFETLIAKRELHGLVLAMSTENLRAASLDDLWLRFVIVFFAGISAVGVGVAWRNLGKSSELQIRLVRASEMNLHLKELNLAAAGLAHETRNPLNIIRGLAQMISKQPEAPDEIKQKSRDIVDETDKITAQLNEFINYSRPRELRRIALPLRAAATEVVRALGYDIEEKKLHVEVKGDTLIVEADEQLLRQALFNLVLNAIQAVDGDGRIEILAQRAAGTEATLEIRDNGPGVPPERRKEIFKPYFTTHQTGTGLGLAVVQQIVLAHGWEIECLANDPKGAIFRITHLKLAA